MIVVKRNGETEPFDENKFPVLAAQQRYHSKKLQQVKGL